MASTSSGSGSDGDVSGMLTKHKKQVVLRFLQEYGCTSTNLEVKATSRMKDYNRIVDFICNSCSAAEAAVDSDYDATSLNNIGKWLNYYKDSPVADSCKYETAYVVNAIGRNESHPEEESSDGINFTEAYNFVENALLGQGQKPLSNTTKQFLTKEFELLIAEANTDHSDNLTRELGVTIDNFQAQDCGTHTHNYSLNPFHLDY